MADKNDEVIHKGRVTEYRPRKDDVSGGRDKSVQAEALGAEGLADVSNSSATSGGASGKVNTVDRPAAPRRDGGTSPDDETQPAGDRGNLTR